MRTSIITILLVFLSAIACLADGLPIKDGRYNGESIIINITESQKQFIAENYKPYFDFPLTQEQQEIIGKKIGMSSPPTKLILLKMEQAIGECRTRQRERDCSCRWGNSTDSLCF